MTAKVIATSEMTGCEGDELDLLQGRGTRPLSRWGNEWLRRGVIHRLTGIRGGQLLLSDDRTSEMLGEVGEDGLAAHVAVRDARFYRQVALGGSLGAAESYLDGDWDCDDLTSMFRIFCRSRSLLESMDRGAAGVVKAAARMGHRLARNTRRGSRKNIEAHYDLGDDFFELFLDPTMMYSSAIFERPEMSLEEAQLARLDRICRTLELRPQEHLIEIGTGWGGLAIHAARHYGCRVTTTTISENQYRTAQRRVRDAGVQDRVEVLKQDYRDLRGRYDKLVSIEMIEAVGHRFYDTFFNKCGQLLKPDGRMLVQAITMPEQRYENYLRSVDFIQKYIFPGGCLPSVSAMQQSIARQTDLRLLQYVDFATDYARTLREWRGRFHERIHDVRELGYSERFLRMWDYYLCYCEAAFLERAVGVAHLVWAR